MEAVIQAWCVGCRRYVPPPPDEVHYGANHLGSPYVAYPCPRGHEVRWFLERRSRRDLPPAPGAAEAEARAQCYAEGIREGRALVQRQLDQVARIMDVFRLEGDFRIGLGISRKTFKRMVKRALARFESKDDG